MQTNLDTWRGKRIAITGTHPWYGRSNVEAILQSVCAVVVNSVNAKTDLLARASGAPEGSKTKNANKLGIEIYDLVKLVELAQQGLAFPGTTPSLATQNAATRTKHIGQQKVMKAREKAIRTLPAKPVCTGFVGF